MTNVLKKVIGALLLAVVLVAGAGFGYLYFRKPDLKKKSSLDLTWYGPAGQIRLVLPTTK